MIFAPARLGSVTLDNETLAADKKGCRRFGPCGVGEKALYLNSFFIDRHYYVALESVRRVFKRVAMSKGGFTGKGAFGSIPYLVVEYDDGAQKQCNFKHEEDVDNLLAYLAKICPDLPLQSQKVERHMAQQQAQEARRYLKELTPQAQAERERLEQARAFLEDHTNLTRRLSQAAKAKRVNDRSNPSYKWVALAIVIAGVAALVYGIITMVRGTSSLGIYFALFGFAAVFLFSGAHVLPHRPQQQDGPVPGVGTGPGGSGGGAAQGLSSACPLCPPGGADPDDPRSAGGPGPDRRRGAGRGEAGPEGPDRRCPGGAVGV